MQLHGFHRPGQFLLANMTDLYVISYCFTYMCWFLSFYNTGTQEEGTKSTALNAVALQDHLMRQLSLTSSSTAKSPRYPTLNNIKRGIKFICVTNLNKQFILGGTNKKLNKGVDCWLSKPRKKLSVNVVGSKEKEFVLDPKPPPLSLGNMCICVSVH